MNQFDINLQNFINDIPLIINEQILVLATDAKALIQQRVQEKGLNASGGKTPEYSESYALYRKKKGRQTGFMDLTLTGEMWRSTGVVNKEQDAKQTKATLAGRDEETQRKIDYNSQQRFEVLKLSKDEEDVLQDIFNENFTMIIIDKLSQGI